MHPPSMMALATHRPPPLLMAPGQGIGPGTPGQTMLRITTWISSLIISPRRIPNLKNHPAKIRSPRLQARTPIAPQGRLGDQRSTTSRLPPPNQARKRKVAQRPNRRPLKRETVRAVRSQPQRSESQPRTLEILPQRPNPANSGVIRQADQHHRLRREAQETRFRAPTCSPSPIATRCRKTASWWRMMAQCWPQMVRCE